MEIFRLNQFDNSVIPVPRNITQRADNGNRKLHSFGLMYSKERNAATRSVFAIVLILANAAVKEKPHIHIEEFLHNAVNRLDREDVYSVKILILCQNLREHSEVTNRAQVNRTVGKLCIKYFRKRRELHKLIKHSRKCVVGVFDELNMISTFIGNPPLQLLAVVLLYVFSRLFDTALVVGAESIVNKAEITIFELIHKRRER